MEAAFFFEDEAGVEGEGITGVVRFVDCYGMGEDSVAWACWGEELERAVA